MDGVPILIDDASSVFSIATFLARQPTFHRPHSRLRLLLQRLVPSRSRNVRATQNYVRLAELLKTTARTPLVLIVGGSVVGEGLPPLLSRSDISFLETDVSFGPRTQLICDAHRLPFASGYFDAVVAQAVLEHVVDPYVCVDEFHRVLKDDGLVYAETPFMQQVHGGRYDFARFTHLGHRRLFRRFTEIDSGAACGPGMALAWAYEYFLLSFVRGDLARATVKAVARFTSSWLMLFDGWLSRTSGGLDAASGYFFLGRKSATVLSDQELVRLYRGAAP